MARSKSTRVLFLDADPRKMGPEPHWVPGQVITQSQIRHAYNWYNYFYMAEDAKKWTLLFLKVNKTGGEILQKLDNNIPKHRFIPVGWACKIIQENGTLPKENMDYLKSKLRELITEAMEAKSDTLAMMDVVEGEEGGIVVIEKEKPNVQEYIANQVSNLIAEFEDVLDQFIQNGYKTDFKTYEYLVSHNVKSIQAQKIAAYYEPLVKELQEAMATPSKIDEQIKEAYSHLTKKQIKAYHAFVSEIVTDCQQIKVNTQAVRKPRKKKIKSAGQVVQKMKYKVSDDTFKIKSVHPSEMVGAQQVWVFNCKTRKLGVFNAEDAGGLKVKGSTVYAWNEDTSTCKKVRKPNEILPQVTQGGKVALRKLMENIRAKDSVLKGRIGADTCILRVVK
jgi:hypothetical protein